MSIVYRSLEPPYKFMIDGKVTAWLAGVKSPVGVKRCDNCASQCIFNYALDEHFIALGCEQCDYRGWV